MLLGLALMVSGAVILLALRQALWQRLDNEEPEVPPPDRVHYVGPGDDPAGVPPGGGDGIEYGSRPIYVPSERGTVYVSRTVERAD